MENYYDKIDEIISEYSDTVYRLAYSMTKNKEDADDVYQEVFLRYIKRNQKFNSEEHRKAWLLRVTVNCSKKLLQSSWRRNTTMLNDDIIQEENNCSFSDNFELPQLIAMLSPKYKTVIHLFYYEELSVKEIAKLTKQKPSTVRSQLTRARQMLKERLGDDYEL